jgi:hypothetical protein
LPHYFAPNFLRPLPVEEEEEKHGRMDGNIDGGASEIDYLNDEMDAIWLIPGTLPEPFWDYTMCQDFSTLTLRDLLTKAIRGTLKEEERKTFSRALKIDPELVFHIGMTPKKLPNLVKFNPLIAFDLLICMTHTN